MEQKVKNVVERYINSTNKEFVNDYIAVIKYINQQNIDDEVKLKMKMQCIHHFLGIIKKHNLKIGTVCSSRDRRVCAEVSMLLDNWVATQDDDFQVRALGIIAYTEDPITAAFLHQVMEWKKDTLLKNKALQQKYKTATVEDFQFDKIGTTNKYAATYAAIEKYDAMFYAKNKELEVDEFFTYIAKTYPTIAKQLANEINSEEWDKAEKQRVYGMFQTHHKDRIREYCKLNDIDFVEDTEELYRQFTSECLYNTTDEYGVMQLQSEYTDMITARHELYLCDDRTFKNMCNRIMNFVPPTPRPKREEIDRIANVIYHEVTAEEMAEFR